MAFDYEFVVYSILHLQRELQMAEILHEKVQISREFQTNTKRGTKGDSEGNQLSF